MARLDYALLTEHARVDPGGTLSVLGGSFSRLAVASVPAQVHLAVAGRVLIDGEEDPISVRVTFDGPVDSGLKVSFETELEPPGDDPVEGVAPAITFAVAGPWPVPSEGLYAITVQVAESEPARMTFRVSLATRGDSTPG